MFQKKKMQLKNLKKPKKHMLSYLIQKKENNMISLDTVPSIIMVVASLDSKALILVICLIFLMTFSEEWASLQVEVVEEKLTVLEKEMMFYIE